MVVQYLRYAGSENSHPAALRDYLITSGGREIALLSILNFMRFATKLFGSATLKN